MQAKAIAKARPVLTVFGYCYISHGVEVVTWGDEGVPDDVVKVEILVIDGVAVELDFTTPELRFERAKNKFCEPSLDDDSQAAGRGEIPARLVRLAPGSVDLMVLRLSAMAIFLVIQLLGQAP